MNHLGRSDRLLALLALSVASFSPQAGAQTAPVDRASDGADLRHEPAVQRIVVEDGGARIEELRVRGQTQRVIVRPKAAGAAAYEIIVPTAARDVSAGPGANRGAAGQRVWSLMSF